MLRSCRLEIVQGKQARPYATMLWLRMDEMQRAAFLWDLSMSGKQYFFEDACAAATLAGVGMSNAGAETIAWLNATGYGCKTAAIHFASACASLPMLADYGRAFLRRAAREFETLVAMIPQPWRGARNYCRLLGFEELGVFARACRIALHDRCVNGCLLKLDLNQYK